MLGVWYICMCAIRVSKCVVCGYVNVLVCVCVCIYMMEKAWKSLHKQM